MFANTLTVTINAIAKVLVRINQDKNSSEYSLKEATQSFRLLIQHQKGTAKKKSPVSATAQQYEFSAPSDRIRVFVEQTVYATATAPQHIYSASVSFPFVDGSSTVDTRNLVLGLQGLTISAFLDQLIQGES